MAYLFLWILMVQLKVFVSLTLDANLICKKLPSSLTCSF